MQLFDTLLVENLVFLFQTIEIKPFFWIQEIHEIEKFTDIVVEWRLSDNSQHV